MSTFRNGNLKMAIETVRHNKARSFLTMLGIVIGVVAVVLVVSIGQGVKQQIAKQIDHFGPDIITVRPGGDAQGFDTASLLSGNGLPGSSSVLLNAADVDTVTHTKGVAYAVPLAIASGSATGDHELKSPLVIATSEKLPDALKQSMATGVFFDPEAGRRTVVLGATVAQQLFDDAAPLGQAMTYRGEEFIVTGILKPFNSAPLSLSANFNNAIFVPYNAAQTLNGGNLAVYQILVKSSSASDAPALARAIDQRLTTEHGGSDQISVLTADKSSQGSNEIIHLLTLLTIGVAIIAFLVGGIGIMDVMLVSVTERMHEIGLRKAIGATKRQIMKQFMAEAFVLSATGGVIAVALSAAIIGLMRVYTSLEPVIVWQIMVAAPLIAIAVGILFGTAPAIKAARKDPIEALRHE
ncbi:ABC transporter permease [Candidatus Saccharibacteria bacterium]|nr:MAG: ABC transporter permease [Candidatus Saccharibacteria bacterium]